MPSMTSLGGTRGLFGLLLIALALGLAYGSLAGSVLGKWVPAAGDLSGIVLLGLAGAILILIWLVGALLR